MSRNSDAFATVRVEGAILPADLLQRVAAGDPRLEGLRPEDYHLAGEKVNEATNHAWNRLLPIWEAFRTAADKLPASDPGQSITLTKWLLPFWRTLEYGQLEAAKPFEIDDKSYPISHVRYHSPIHLVGFRQDLDKRVETPEGKRPSPHGLVQEFLNRSEQHLWGFVSNGLRLRILRDNIRLTRQAFVEFDLQAMFDGKVYADFALLWRLCHESRVMAEKPEQCWLERWSKVGSRAGSAGPGSASWRGREGHRGVGARLPASGQRGADRQAAIRHAQVPGLLPPIAAACVPPALSVRRRGPRPTLRPASRRGHAGPLLSLLLHCPAAADRRADSAARSTPTSTWGWNWCSTAWAPRAARSWASPLSAACSIRRARRTWPSCRIANADLLEAVRALSVVDDERSRAKRPVDYRNLGSEELGSVYESLLELHPQFDPRSAHVRADNRRRQRTQDDRQLLHADQPDYLPARLGPRSRSG